MARIPKGITKANVLQAIAKLDASDPHPFGPSTKYDLVHEGRRYPPKAVLGLAAERSAGRALTPRDFTGGDQTNGALERLGFEIVNIRSERHRQPDRSDPAVAGNIIDELTHAATASERSACLQFLAESIQYIAARCNDRWDVTLYRKLVRFNVGQVHCINLNATGISVLVDGDPGIVGVDLGEHRYVSAGDSQLASLEYRSVAKLLPVLRARHEAAIRHAEKRKFRHIVGAHAPGVVQQLWQELELPGPVPAPIAGPGGSPPRAPPTADKDLAVENAIMARPDLSETEKLAVVKVRLAQRLFRSRLTASRRCCCLTGVTNPAYLRASHIKPWRACSDQEIQDPNNGLLLAPHVDLLFDQGHLSFEDDGTLMVSKWADRSVLEAWGLQAGRKVAPFPASQRQYLEHHRKVEFERRGK